MRSGPLPHCEVRPFSLAETHEYGELDHTLLASSEPLGWRSLLVLDSHVEARAAHARVPSVKDHMISFQLSGTTTLHYRLGDVRGSKTVYPGQASFVPGGYDMCGSNEAASDVMNVYIRASLVDQVFEQRGAEERGELIPQVGIIDPIMSGLIYGCAAARSWQRTNSQAYIDHFAWALAAHISENYSSCTGRQRNNNDGPLPPNVIRIVDDYIRSHIAYDIGVSDIAQAAGYNAAYFTIIFKRTLGMPPYKYLLNRRIQAVREALHTKAGLADIAVATGFCNQEHMTRMFRKFHGISPSAYRRQSRGAG